MSASSASRRASAPSLLLRGLAHVRILERLLSVDLRDDLLIRRTPSTSAHFRDRLGVGAELGVVALDGRIRHLSCQLLS